MKTNYRKKPFVRVKGNHKCTAGWERITTVLREMSHASNTPDILVETYQGVHFEELITEMNTGLEPRLFIDTRSLMKTGKEIQAMVYPDVTSDRIFGYLSRLCIDDYFDPEKLEAARKKKEHVKGRVLILGPGASLLSGDSDLLVYADMARWEIQMRMRRKEVDNLGLSNRNTDDWMLLYKQGFFVDWRVCDRLKKTLFERIDYVLDTNIPGLPKMVSGSSLLKAYEQTLNQPFSVVPFFDPGPWGGQWMKEVCGLEKDMPNYAWCFNCVPEENSILYEFDGERVELPSINLVLRHPAGLLGDPVHARFGDEFPIRFDFLDTMDGGNLSLQVHPLTEYIQEKFGMHYTQDESYYMMDTKEDAMVYLGLREDTVPEECLEDLRLAQENGKEFPADKYVQTWPVKKHDHVLIPGGTIHCSGKNSMVLEISATPYIFTFKLWDWGRLGLDGKPRPINLEHGKNVIQWDRRTEWTRRNLVNRVRVVAEGKDWVEESTGLHEREFIETRRHWFTGPVYHDNRYGVEVICLVEGEEVLIESPGNEFEPFPLYYAEVAIIPAGVNRYLVKPGNAGNGDRWGTIKAYVRS